jgi:hypothetical protein
MVLLISASLVARIIDVSYWHPAPLFFLILVFGFLFLYSSPLRTHALPSFTWHLREMSLQAQLFLILQPPPGNLPITSTWAGALAWPVAIHKGQDSP